MCRERILKAIGECDAGRVRLDAHDERVDRAIAERIKHDDKTKKKEESIKQAQATAFEPAAPPAAVEPRPSPMLGSGQRPPESARVRTAERTEQAEWRNVPGGERAPATPPRAPSPERAQPSEAPAEPSSSRVHFEDMQEDHPIDDNQGDEGGMEVEGEEDVHMGFVGSLAEECWAHWVAAAIIRR